MIAIFLIIGTIIAILTCLLFGRQKYKNSSNVEIAVLKEKLSFLDKIEKDNEKLRGNNLDLEKSIVLLETTNEVLENNNKILEQEKSISFNKYSNLEQEKNKINDEKIRLETKVQSLEQSIDNEKIMLDNLRANLKSMSAELIQQNREEVLKESKQSLSSMISPLQDNIKDFKEKIDSIHKTDIEGRASLQVEIKNMVEITNKIGNQANSLADALKSKPKMQGNWGEMILENTLKESGLEKGISYIAQGIGLQLQGPDDFNLKQPDIILKLPNEQSIIIDAKVSLVNYERYCNSELDLDKELYFSNFINDVKNHINNLSEKDYPNISSSKKTMNVLGHVLMFIPIEGTYYTTLQYDQGSIHQYAWKKGVVIVSPYNLMPILKAIASICQIEQQNKNVQEIAQLAGGMYDKFVVLLDEISRIENSFSKIIESFSNTKRIINGHGGLVGRAEKLKKLGAKTNKNIPNIFIESSSDNAEEIKNDNSSV